MPTPDAYLRIAIPSPLRRVFDYLPPKLCSTRLEPGMRVKVPFGQREVVGVLLGTADQSDVPRNKLKHAIVILDDLPVVPRDIFRTLNWAAGYYHHPIGEVFATALPALLRTDAPAQGQQIDHWQVSPMGATIDPTSLKRAPRQAALLHRLQQARAEGLGAHVFSNDEGDWRGAINRLEEHGWVTHTRRDAWQVIPPPRELEGEHTLNPEQAHAVTVVTRALAEFQTFLLEGITGSGKTEVYLRIIESVLAQGRQALVLVPEIGLTPQLVQRFNTRLNTPLVVLHSHLTDHERLNAWLAARENKAGVVIGTRSALFTPLPGLGVIIVDEEHDLSYKQQDGFRYHARDLAIMRARECGVPIVLGSATPSLESLFNVQQGRSQVLHLSQRAGNARPPQFRVLDIRGLKMSENLSPPLIQTTRAHLAANGQVLLFLNRRGYAPMLLCHGCGWVATCPRCDARMTLHRHDHRLRCHHCGSERPLPNKCPECKGEELRQLGYGTERIEEDLQQHFPDATIVRIDRDSTRRKGSMQQLLDEIHSGRGQILVGTQMLAKGHHFPQVTLAAILDADYGLYSADFRAAERMAQQVLQVAGRSGRAERQGEVLIQTHHPENPLLATLLQRGYRAFAGELLQERQATTWPPYSHLALLRAEATHAEQPMAFLQQAKQLAARYQVPGVQLLGPLPAPMPKRAGRYRAQLLIQASERPALHQLLKPWVLELENAKTSRQVRWTLDVDPMELF